MRKKMNHYYTIVKPQVIVLLNQLKHYYNNSRLVATGRGNSGGSGSGSGGPFGLLLEHRNSFILKIFLIFVACQVVSLGLFFIFHRSVPVTDVRGNLLAQPSFKKKQQQQQQQQYTNSSSSSSSSHNFRGMDGKKNNNKKKNNDNNTTTTTFHVVFSTGCHIHNWQSYVMFYHVVKSKQQGHVTRVASGCNEEEGQRLMEHHANVIEPIRPGFFHLHLTPDYQFVKPGTQNDQFNREYGIRHWLQNGLQYASNVHLYENVIFIVLDPDQILMRPFTDDFTDETILWSTTATTTVAGGAAGTTSQKQSFYVQHGVAFGQDYSGTYEFDMVRMMNMEHIAPVNELPSPIHQLSSEDILQSYSVGPPLIMTGRDFYKVVQKWADFTTYVYDQNPRRESGSLSYAVAAAHIQLPHQTAQSFMVSLFAGERKEGWKFIDDQFTHQDVCTKPSVNQWIQEGYPLPHTIHYRYRYMLGKWFFNKFFVPQTILSCEAPLLMEPPQDISLKYDFGITRDGRRQNYTIPKIRKRLAFAICQLIYAVNEAMMHYKNHNCDLPHVNMEKTFIFHDDMEIKWNSYMDELGLG